MGIRLEDGRNLGRATNPPHIEVLLSIHSTIEVTELGWGYQPRCTPCVLLFANDRNLHQRAVWGTNLHRKVSVRVQGVWRSQWGRTVERYCRFPEPTCLLGLSPQPDRFVFITTVSLPPDHLVLGNKRILSAPRSFEERWLTSKDEVEDLTLEAQALTPNVELGEPQPAGHLNNLMKAWPRERDSSDQRRIIPGVPGEKLLKKLLNPELH